MQGDAGERLCSKCETRPGGTGFVLAPAPLICVRKGAGV
jgi:hypothetical protein